MTAFYEGFSGFSDKSVELIVIPPRFDISTNLTPFGVLLFKRLNDSCMAFASGFSAGVAAACSGFASILCDIPFPQSLGGVRYLGTHHLALAGHPYNMASRSVTFHCTVFDAAVSKSFRNHIRRGFTVYVEGV